MTFFLTDSFVVKYKQTGARMELTVCLTYEANKPDADNYGSQPSGCWVWPHLLPLYRRNLFKHRPIISLSTVATEFRLRTTCKRNVESSLYKANLIAAMYASGSIVLQVCSLFKTMLIKSKISVQEPPSPFIQFPVNALLVIVIIAVGSSVKRKSYVHVWTWMEYFLTGDIFPHINWGLQDELRIFWTWLGHLCAGLLLKTLVYSMLD